MANNCLSTSFRSTRNWNCNWHLIETFSIRSTLWMPVSICYCCCCSSNRKFDITKENFIDSFVERQRYQSIGIVRVFFVVLPLSVCLFFFCHSNMMWNHVPLYSSAAVVHGEMNMILCANIGGANLNFNLFSFSLNLEATRGGFVDNCTDDMEQQRQRTFKTCENSKSRDGFREQLNTNPFKQFIQMCERQGGEALCIFKFCNNNFASSLRCGLPMKVDCHPTGGQHFVGLFLIWVFSLSTQAR